MYYTIHVKLKQNYFLICLQKYGSTVVILP